jgi:hypothetical protein
MSNNRSYIDTVSLLYALYLFFDHILVSGRRAGKPEMVGGYGTHGALASTNNKFIIGKPPFTHTLHLAPYPYRWPKKNKVELSANVIFNDLTSFPSLFQTKYCTFHLLARFHVLFTAASCLSKYIIWRILNNKDNNFISWLNYIIKNFLREKSGKKVKGGT